MPWEMSFFDYLRDWETKKAPIPAQVTCVSIADQETELNDQPYGNAFISPQLLRWQTLPGPPALPHFPLAKLLQHLGYFWNTRLTAALAFWPLAALTCVGCFYSATSLFKQSFNLPTSPVEINNYKHNVFNSVLARNTTVVKELQWRASWKNETWHRALRRHIRLLSILLNEEQVRNTYTLIPINIKFELLRLFFWNDNVLLCNVESFVLVFPKTIKL